MSETEKNADKRGFFPAFYAFFLPLAWNMAEKSRERLQESNDESQAYGAASILLAATAMESWVRRHCDVAARTGMEGIDPEKCDLMGRVFRARRDKRDKRDDWRPEQGRPSVPQRVMRVGDILGMSPPLNEDKSPLREFMSAWDTRCSLIVHDEMEFQPRGHLEARLESVTTEAATEACWSVCELVRLLEEARGACRPVWAGIPVWFAETCVPSESGQAND